MTVSANKALVRRFYEELQNDKNLDLAYELMHPDVQFRGSLGRTMICVGDWIAYQKAVNAAIPDFHNTIEEMVGEGDTVTARLIYSGTHVGELFGFRGTSRRITYVGVAFFTIRDDRIARGWVLGDLYNLLPQLGFQREIEDGVPIEA